VRSWDLRTHASICAAKSSGIRELLRFAKRLREPIDLVTCHASAIDDIRRPGVLARVPRKFHPCACRRNECATESDFLPLHLAVRLADTGVMRGLPGYRYVLSVYRSIVDRLLHRKITPSVESGQSFSPRDRLAAQHQSPISHPCHDSVDVSRAQRLALLNRSADHAVESSVPQLACEIDRVELLQFGPRVREELGLLILSILPTMSSAMLRGLRPASMPFWIARRIAAIWSSVTYFTNSAP